MLPCTRVLNSSQERKMRDSKNTKKSKIHKVLFNEKQEQKKGTKSEMRWRHSGVARESEFTGSSHTTTTHQTLNHWRSLMEEMRLCKKLQDDKERRGRAVRRSKRSRTRRFWRAQKRRSFGEPGQIGRAVRPQKDMCTKMVSPTRGSWKKHEKACRYLREVEKVTW